MPDLQASMHADDEGLNRRQEAAKTKTDSCCERCRRDKKRCEGGIPCDRCFEKERACSLVDEHIVSMKGPTSTITNHNGGYFVIYSLPNGNTFAAHLNGNYQLIGRARYLGHQSVLATATYYRDFNVNELLDPGLARACEMHIHQNTGVGPSGGAQYYM